MVPRSSLRPGPQSAHVDYASHPRSQCCFKNPARSLQVDPLKGLVTDLADNANEMNDSITPLHALAEIVRTQHRTPHPLHSVILSRQRL